MIKGENDDKHITLGIKTEPNINENKISFSTDNNRLIKKKVKKIKKEKKNKIKKNIN